MVLLCCRFLLSICPASFMCLLTSFSPCLEIEANTIELILEMETYLCIYTLIALMSVPGRSHKEKKNTHEF